MVHLPRYFWFLPLFCVCAIPVFADESCESCDAAAFPEAEQLLAALGFSSDEYETLVAWEEAVPGEPGRLVRGVHLRPRSGGEAFDVYLTPEGQLLTDAERQALGVVPKDWSPEPVGVDSEPYAGPVQAGEAPPAPVSASQVKALARVQLPPVDIAEVREEDAQGLADLPKGVRRIGVVLELPEPIRVAAAEASTGVWRSQPDGTRVWATVLEGPGAVGQRLHFTGMALPAGARLLVYNAQNPEERYAVAEPGPDGEAWSPTCFAEQVGVECVVSAEAAGQPLGFTIDSAVYVYSGPGDWNWEKAAGTCNIDVSCHPGWADLAQGVGGLGTVGRSGYLWCTGTLIADRDPSTSVPYFLTANHCVSTQAQADSLEVYWLYQTTACNGTPPNPRYVPRTTGGADFLAGSNYSTGNDFALLRLRGSLPGGVSFLGWETESTPDSTAVVCIHHPAGDYKRISFGNISQAVPVQFGFSPDRYYGVYWTQGVTEPGSSGSPIFDTTTRRLLGQLWGGTSSCDKPRDPDVYGRFDRTYPVVRAYLGMQLRVLQPNGGEVWAPGSTQNIRWTATDDQKDNVRIELLKRGGVFLLLEPEAPDTGSYSWTIPANLEESAEYRVRVTSSTEETTYDDSDDNFSIVSELRIELATPNGGENWPTGSRQTISWSAPGLAGSVRIELLRNGALVATVADATENDGSYTWDVRTDLAPGSGYTVRISSNQAAGVEDESNGPFDVTMEPSITVLSPDGGENWPRGRVQTITWFSTGLQDASVTLELLRVSRGDQPVSVIVQGTANDGSFEWTVPANLDPAADYLLRVVATAAASVSDESDGTFWVGDCAPPPPNNVSASDGTFAERVRVAWSPSSGATAYRVYRSETDQLDDAAPVSDWQGDTVFYDYSALPLPTSSGCSGGTSQTRTYRYWVQARNSCDTGGFGESDTGYRGAYKSASAGLASGMGDLLVAGGAVAGLLAAGRLQARRRRLTLPES